MKNTIHSDGNRNASSYRNNHLTASVSTLVEIFISPHHNSPLHIDNYDDLDSRTKSSHPIIRIGLVNWLVLSIEDQSFFLSNHHAATHSTYVILLKKVGNPISLILDRTLACIRSECSRSNIFISLSFLNSSFRGIVSKVGLF